MHIYYADDDEDDMFLFTMAVEEINPAYSITRFNSGIALLKALAESVVPHNTVVFIDINMPKMNGLECLREIRLIPRLKDLPINILSTSPAFMFQQQAEESGADGYIQKALTYDEYKQRITNAIEQAKNK